MKWIINFFSQAFNFKGRASRKEYWYTMVLVFILLIIATMIDNAIGKDKAPLITRIFLFLILIPSISITIRRLHDTGKSGLIFLAMFIPIIGQLWLFILLALKGNSFTNKYGPVSGSSKNEEGFYKTFSVDQQDFNDDENTLLNQASKALTSKNYEESINLYNQLSEKYPERKGLYLSQIGANYFFLKDYDKAIDYYLEAYQLGENKSMMDDNIWEACEIKYKKTKDAKAIELYLKHFPKGKYAHKASQLIGKEINTEQEENDNLYWVKKEEPAMQKAFKDAQKNFRYFWREMYWERKRVIPGHRNALIKVPFSQKLNSNKNPTVEYMWISDIDFDGEIISGILVSSPQYLTNISSGDQVRKTISEIADWLILIDDKAIGGFTVQAIRAGMNDKERDAHDKAWNTNFGNYNTVTLVNKQEQDANFLIDHPMSINTADKMRDYFTSVKDELNTINKNGLTILQEEAIAGNKISIDFLLTLGAQKDIKSAANKTAYDYAKSLGWEHLLDILK